MFVNLYLSYENKKLKVIYHILPNKERWLNDEGDDTSILTDIIIIIIV